MKVFSFNHRDHALDVIERLSPLAQDDLEVTLRQIPGVRGAVVLATCNRIEILVECDPDAAPSRDAETAIADLLAAPLVGTPLAGERARTYEGEAVIDHLCTLACGLESMVVGSGRSPASCVTPCGGQNVTTPHLVPPRPQSTGRYRPHALWSAKLGYQAWAARLHPWL